MSSAAAGQTGALETTHVLQCTMPCCLPCRWRCVWLARKDWHAALPLVHMRPRPPNAGHCEVLPTYTPRLCSFRWGADHCATAKQDGPHLSSLPTERPLAGEQQVCPHCRPCRSECPALVRSFPDTAAARRRDETSALESFHERNAKPRHKHGASVGTNVTFARPPLPLADPPERPPLASHGRPRRHCPSPCLYDSRCLICNG